MKRSENIDNRLGNKYENKRSKRKIIFLLILMMVGSISVIKVDAYIPVAYVCCQNYSLYNGNLINGFEDTSNSGIQLDNFENINNWTVGGTGASEQADTVNYIDGKQGLKLIAINGNKANIVKNINNNFSNTNNFIVWVYVFNVSTISNVTIQFTSSPTWNTAFYSRDITNLNQGWNKLILTKGDFYSGSNPESWNNVMNKTKLQIWPKNGMSTNITFDNFRYNTTNDWIVGGSGAYLQPDTTNFIDGQQGLKLIATTGTVSMDLPINNNFSNTNNFAIWAYIDNVSNQNGITLYLTSSGNNWNTFFYDTEWTPGIKTGWNHLIFNKHNFKNTGGEDWNNIMNRVRLRIYPNNANLNVTFDNLVYNMEGKRAKLMFQFDDGSASVYQNAFPILNTNNQSGVAYIVTKWLASDGDTNSTDMNPTNLRNLQSAGWDISSHTLDHPDLTSLNDSSLISELNDSYAWLVTNGFQKSAGFIAYPFGKFNDNVIDKTRKRYIFGRSTYSEASQQYTTTTDNTIQYIQRIIVTSNMPVQSIISQINDSINSKLLSIVLFHVINDTNPTNDPYTFLTTDFQNISNYVKSRSADIDVITYSDDYVVPQINNFTPVINKTTRIYYNGSSTLISHNKYDEYMPNMTINPSSDSVDIYITKYDETGGSVQFNESIANNIQVSYNIGDRIPNQLYSVNVSWINGTHQNFSIKSNNTGYINYNLLGNSRYQDIEPLGGIDTTFTVTLPAGYTSLRFNFNNSNAKNQNPDGQTDSQPFFSIKNDGNIDQNFVFYLNDNAINTTTYADLSNNFTYGKIPINTSNSTIVIPNLAPGNNQNIWMIADANRAPSENVNLSLTIGVIQQTIIPNFVSNNCDPSLWNHIWGENQNLTYRLLLNTTYPCISVSGTISHITYESDGDDKMYLTLDKEYSSSLAQPEIDLEIICANANSTNMSVCNNFSQNYLMNNISEGVHVNVTGAYILDLSWNGNEIHPVTSIGPAILSKFANMANYSNVGDIIQYNYTITNTGNVELNGLSITDNKTGIVPCYGTLIPGKSIQCTSNYTVTQTDINNGAISNNAFISIVSNGTIINSNLATTTVYKK